MGRKDGRYVDDAFAVQREPVFTRDHVFALAAGNLAAVVVPSFLDAGTCIGAMEAISRLPVKDVNAKRVPDRVTRFGPSLHDYRSVRGDFEADAYWEAADTARSLWAAARVSPDPVRLAIDRISAGWGSPIKPATINGRSLFSGMFRDVNFGIRIHFDEITQEYPRGLFDQELAAQLSFNLWVQVPRVGGATTIWRRRWHPQDYQFRDGYAVHSTIIDGFPDASFKPRAGDAALFNSGYMHAVEDCHGDRRVAFSFFLGLTESNELIAWA
ncbi:2OG-Fe(II)-dependent halogenase WelO5 family protein [Streptomyces sp. 1222.5]|uniref:2OG-Fe(II)-dependent halogenase WelO5 family protein n=1 Tax=Streptomyces sp. 1222.5 TaxID=1881026 RepID=UPI003EBB39BD